MAKKIIEVVVDDLTGEEFSAGDGETIEFSYRGNDYTIDLLNDSAGKFDEALEPFIGAATKVSGRRTRPASRTSTKPDSTAVRAWAASNGISLAPRGRIPASVVEQFQAAGN